MTHYSAAIHIIPPPLFASDLDPLYITSTIMVDLSKIPLFLYLVLEVSKIQVIVGNPPSVWIVLWIKVNHPQIVESVEDVFPKEGFPWESLVVFSLVMLHMPSSRPTGMKIYRVFLKFTRYIL